LVGIRPVGAAEFAKQIESQAKTKAALVEANFREALRRRRAGDWQFETGSLIQAVVYRAHAADLVWPAGDPDDPLPAVARTLVEDVLMTAGRPLLLIPYAGRFGSIGTNALVGWTPTRESARAVHDSLPLLAAGAKVTVLTVESARSASETEVLPTADIAEHLARHGLDVALPGPWCPTAVASRCTAGLCVRHRSRPAGGGGYGHSRTREMIMGGVTRDLLRHMTLPVLMSH